MTYQGVITEEMAALVRAESARKAGKARMTKMTPEQRRESARRAAQARWGKKAVAPDPSPTDPGSGPERDRQGQIELTSRRPVARTNSEGISGRSRAAVVA